MVTTKTDTDLADAHRWALRTLNDAKLTDPVDTTDLLRLITRSSYVLPANAVEAVCIVSNPEAANPFAINFGQEDRLTEKVAEFARAFFQLSPDQRRRRWLVLYDSSAELPGLLRWLDHLEGGLDIEDVPSTGNKTLTTLTKICCDVFVAKPPAYQRLRQAFEQKVSEDGQLWDAPIAEFVRRNPKFVHAIAPWVESIAKRQLPAADELVQLSALHNRKSKTAKERTAKAETERDAWPWWAWLLIMFVLRILFKILKELNS